MKFNAEVRDFLEKYININNQRLDKARSIVSGSTNEEKKGSLVKFLENNIDEAYFDGTGYQGSMAYFTIIRPHPDNDEGRYDVDVAVKFKYNSNRDGNEKEYYNLVYNCLKDSDRYKEKITNDKERSVRVEYDSNNGEFYVDLVPMFQKDNNWRVVNSEENKKEISGGFLFRDWVNEQNNKTSIEGSQEKFLKKIIRIYKFFRNQGNISHVKSVQITLLLSRQVDKLKENCFGDISSTLYYISKELKKEIEQCESIEDIDLSNPKLSEEIFSRGFDTDTFLEFKESIIEHIDRIINAYEEENEDISLELRQLVFGEKFGNLVKINKSTYLSVDYPHAELPQKYSRIESDNCALIDIIGTHNKSNKNHFYQNKPIRFSSKQPIIIKQDLCFYAILPKNLGNNTLYRQITNEDNQYVENLRGQIANESKSIGYDDNKGGHGIGETGQRPGKHRVKCYLVNENKIIIAKSKEFIVNLI